MKIGRQRLWSAWTKEVVMLSVIEVKTKKQRKEFVEYPLRLYKDNPYFVPPLYMDEMALFTDKNIYNKTCESAFFLAIRDGVTVGRIQTIIQRQYNDIYNTKQVRFTRFDCENDPETAKALFDTAEAWAKEKGMDTVVGPLGYSDMEREGLLIEGFDYLSTYEEQYNYEYYGGLVESCGYVKDVDWVESRLFSTPQQDERLLKLAERSMRKSNLHLAGVGMKKSQFLKKYAKQCFACLDECYKELYGFVPYTQEMMDQMLAQFKLFINLKYILAVADENDQIVAFGFVIPGIGKALQKSGGKLTPGCLFRLLKAIRKPESIDLALVAIKPRYRKSGLSALIMTTLQSMLADGSVKYMETNLNLESNVAIQAGWKHFNNIQHKRRRSYIKRLTD